MTKGHPSTPPACCRTVTLWPAITRAPVRSAARLALIANVTVALALPLTVPLNAIQPTSLLAVHAHPLVVVTVTVAEPPIAEMV